jgi:4-methylaminobutanoate oxidase (formaldehyde-forming)
VDVCVVGGGVVGCSVAYHAAEHSSVLLLEQGAIGGGTTWHAAGLVRQARATKSETLRTGVYARQLYRELEELTGLSTGFRATGNVGLARTPERRVEMRRQMSRMRSYGIDVEEVSVEEGVARLNGVVSPEGYCGAFWTPQDGQVDPSNVAAALTKGARMRGAEIRERQRVARIVPDGAGWRIGLADGQEVLASQVVNAAGQWARKLGQLSGVDVPLHSNEHFYIVARPTAGIVVPPDLPTFRDPDGCFYGRGWSGGLLVGWFEQHCKTAFVEGPPDDFEFSLLEDDWEHLEPHLLDIFERIPGLENAQLDQVNGP